MDRTRRPRPGAASTRRDGRPIRPLGPLGPVSRRAPVGHRPRGLFRRRLGLGLLPARPRPLARLPLGRGRPARHLRRPRPAVLRAGAVERRRSDPQGAALRPDGARGQPRRGRQGGLLLPRRDPDATPTCKALYRYPQRAFPYEELVAENARRTRADPEYELVDTGVFADDRYFDVVVEYAKAAAEDILIRITVDQPRPRAAALAPAADALVPQHLVVGPAPRPTDR